MKSESQPKAVVSVAQMCRLMRISRSQFYWHVKRGTFHAPLHLASNKRPYFTALMVEENLHVRETGIGINGEYVIFYERASCERRQSKKKADQSSLIESLKALGLVTVTQAQVEAALAACFPSGTSGTSGQDETAVLRAVFRHLKRPETG